MTKSTREEAELGTKIYLHLIGNKHYKNIINLIRFELPKLKSYEEYKEKYPDGSDGNYYFNLCGRYMEYLGALHYDGHIPVGLVLDGMGSVMYSDEVHMIVEGMRKETDNPVRYENWQYLGNKCREYWEKRKPEPRY